MKNILRGNYLSKVQILGISRNRRMPDDEFLRNSIRECVELLVVDIKNRSIYLKYPRGYKLKTFPLHHYDEYNMVKKSRFGDCFKTFLHCIGDMNIDEIYKNYRFDLFVITAPNKDKSDTISDVLNAGVCLMWTWIISRTWKNESRIRTGLIFQAIIFFSTGFVRNVKK